MKDMNLARRTDLAAFLRARRARLSPRQAGLPEAGTPGRRRTPGLRRQEVAASMAYLGRRPSLAGPGKAKSLIPLPFQPGKVWPPNCLPSAIRTVTRATFPCA